MNFIVTLIRHGQTAWNQQRRFLGATDIGLDEHGWSQARKVGFATRGVFDAIYSSPLSRARQTASCLGDEVVEIADLRELSQGALEGMLAADAISEYPAFFERWKADPTHVAPPGGETLGQCRDRGLQALARMAADHASGDVVAAVSHQLVIASLTCTIDGSPLASWSEYCVGNCAWVGLEWDGVNWQISRADEMARLFSIGPGSRTADV